MNAFNFRRFAEDRGVPIGPGDHKHSRPGWVNVACPFCTGHAGYHLGYEESNQRFRCWRCGFKRTLDVIARLAGEDERGAKRLYRQYQGRPVHPDPPELRVQRRAKPTSVKLPTGTAPMTKRHRDYLHKRGFDPDQLERDYDLQGTGPVGPYKFRIIIPVHYQGRVVTYQGRDITGRRGGDKYRACRETEEARSIRECLYGLDRCRDGHPVVVVEGATDVWRLGRGAVATFGIQFSAAQVRLLAKFRVRYILFDAEEEAQNQAQRLANALSGFGGVTEIVTLDDGEDPADLSPVDAGSLMGVLGMAGWDRTPANR
jgi:hypothetical protein